MSYVLDRFQFGFPLFLVGYLDTIPSLSGILSFLCSFISCETGIMNYLAHLFLSANTDAVLVGNFIADAVKGKQIASYSHDVQQGIVIHRAIDIYTDKHDLVRKGKSRLYPVLGKYSGVVLDVFYDYLLSIDWKYYSDEPKRKFIANAYRVLAKQSMEMPVRMQSILPFFVVHNWLEKYETIDGVRAVMKGMTRHTSLPAGGEESVDIFLQYMQDYHSEFHLFFDSLLTHLESSFPYRFRSKARIVL